MFCSQQGIVRDVTAWNSLPSNPTADLPKRTYQTKVIQSWDTASKGGAQNDWSVCTTWLVVDKERYYLLDVTRGRYEYPQLRSIAVALAEQYKPDAVLIEEASVGFALAPELKKILARPIKPISVEHDKVGRLYVTSISSRRDSFSSPTERPSCLSLKQSC
jgi:phage terminase large subunit-like protein